MNPSNIEELHLMHRNAHKPPGGTLIPTVDQLHPGIPLILSSCMI